MNNFSCERARDAIKLTVTCAHQPRKALAYLGGVTVRCPPLARPWKFFTGDFIWKGAFFAIFQQEVQNSTMFDGLLRFQISEKWANLRFPLNIQKQKVFQLQGGFAPLTPRVAALPLDLAGGSAPDPRYRLALRALAMPPLCQILNTPLAEGKSKPFSTPHLSL